MNVECWWWISNGNKPGKSSKVHKVPGNKPKSLICFTKWVKWYFDTTNDIVCKLLQILMWNLSISDV